MQMISSHTLEYPAIEECCEGLVSYIRFLSVYEMSEESRDTLSDLASSSLRQWYKHDFRVSDEIDKFFSSERNILEKTDFYRLLFKRLIARPEFVNAVGVLGEQTDD